MLDIISFSLILFKYYYNWIKIIKNIHINFSPILSLYLRLGIFVFLHLILNFILEMKLYSFSNKSPGLMFCTQDNPSITSISLAVYSQISGDLPQFSLLLPQVVMVLSSCKRNRKNSKPKHRRAQNLDLKKDRY